MIYNFTDEIVYDSPIGNILNSIKRITDGMKRVNFFWHTFCTCEVIGKFINDRLTDRS